MPITDTTIINLNKSNFRSAALSSAIQHERSVLTQGSCGPLSLPCPVRDKA